MEIWDGYWSDGSLASRDLVRGEPIPKGLYHLVSEVLVRHVDGDFLLMRRHPEKPAYGGYEEATAGGSALKGEDSAACAKRELLEETGICGFDFLQIGRSVSHDTIYDSYLCTTDCDKESVTLQAGETVSFRWLSKKAFSEFVNSNEMIDAQKERYYKYFIKIGFVTDPQQ
jgi:8-oxo-dGTP pyrophosphatase MutT (NUDIX family)